MSSRYLVSRDRFIAAAPDRIFGDGVTGTSVTEQLDARHVRGKFLLRLAGYLRRRWRTSTGPSPGWTGTLRAPRRTRTDALLGRFYCVWPGFGSVGSIGQGESRAVGGAQDTC